MFTVAALVVLSGAEALAADPVPAPVGAAPAVPCDFFEAQLIGAICGRTAYLGVAGEQLNERLDRFVVAPGFNFGRPTLQTGTLQYKYRDSYETGTLAISPWDGVRIEIGTQGYQYNDSYSGYLTSTPLGGFFRGPPPAPTTQYVFGSQSGEAGGWQSIGAQVTVFDKQTNTGRYVFDLSGLVERFLGGGSVPSRDLEEIGFISGAHWGLGATGLSINFYSQDYLQRFDNPGVDRLSGFSRLLLASDVYGVAIGPRLDTGVTLWHAAGFTSGWSAAQLGAEALIEPFRRTNIAVLRDVTVNLTATHSLGQAEFIPVAQGSASAMDYTASARLNVSF